MPAPEELAQCSVRVRIPAFGEGDCPFLDGFAALLAGKELVVAYPCEGGRGEITEIGGRSMDAFRAEQLGLTRKMEDRVTVTRDELILTVRSERYLVYGCMTEVRERLVTALGTGGWTYTYEEQWSGCRPYSCGPIERTGQLIGRSNFR